MIFRHFPKKDCAGCAQCTTLGQVIQLQQTEFALSPLCLSGFPPGTVRDDVRAEIYVSEDGGQETFSASVFIPRAAVPEAMRYLQKHPQIEARTLLRVFAAHWKLGLNLCAERV